MITLEQYFGKFISHPDATEEAKDNAKRLLAACAKLEVLAREQGVNFLVNPSTKSNVSGTQYGGFRPKNCLIGAAKSSHKEGLAVDRYDPDGKMDAWCLAHSRAGEELEQCGIYIEHPNATSSWSHWTIRPPHSGHRVFYP